MMSDERRGATRLGVKAVSVAGQSAMTFALSFKHPRMSVGVAAVITAGVDPRRLFAKFVAPVTERDSRSCGNEFCLARLAGRPSVVFRADLIMVVFDSVN